MGQWGGLKEDSPIWEIRRDSIYYFQHSKAYPYKIVNRDLIINFPESRAILKNISVISDTLFFSGEEGLQIRAYRFKNGNVSH